LVQCTQMIATEHSVHPVFTYVLWMLLSTIHVL
jgi:hypothetical protein